MATFTGQPSIRGGSELVRMMLLTFSAIGITFTWSIETTYCTPYLLNLGLSKSSTSLVWIAGPLSGLVVQPIVGALADQSTSRWGRRRPVVAIATVVTAVCLLLLGFTREFVGLFVGDDDDRARTPTIVLAVLAIYAVDFALNAVMSCSRSLIVDTLPIEKQQTGAAWFSRTSAIGHVLGYAAGAVDMVAVFGTGLGATQFQQLTVVSTIVMLGANAVTCGAVTERILVSSWQSSKSRTRFGFFRDIWTTLRHLPPRINAICWVQFWSWIGWFPFLFYGTTWVGETYFRYEVHEDAKNSKDSLGDMGRVGSTALVLYSTITFAGAFVLPLLVESPEDRVPAAATSTPSVVLGRFKKLKPDLLTTWIAGHIVFSVAMSMAPFATSFRVATVLVCLCGVPWSIAMWAPVAFLGVEVNKLDGGGANGTQYRRLSDASSDIELRDTRDSIDGAPLHLEHAIDTSSNAPVASTGELSGIYFGILNIFTTLPQFVASFISTIVFAILEPGKSPELAEGADPDEHVDTSGPNGIAVCLFIGAMSTLYAAYATRKLKFL